MLMLAIVLYIFARVMGCLWAALQGSFWALFDMESWFTRQNQQQGNTLQKLLDSFIQHEDMVFDW